MTNIFEPAYRQLSPVERVFVDAYVSSVEEMAVKARTTIREAVLMLPAVHDARTLEMLSSALVKAAIADRIRELTESAELNVYRTLKELRSIAYSTIGNYIRHDSEGKVYFDLQGCTPEELACIKSIKVKDGKNGNQEIELSLYDKFTAIKQVMIYQGLIDDDSQHWKIVSASEITEALTTESIDEAANQYARMLENG